MEDMRSDEEEVDEKCIFNFLMYRTLKRTHYTQIRSNTLYTTHTTSLHLISAILDTPE